MKNGTANENNDRLAATVMETSRNCSVGIIDFTRSRFIRTCQAIKKTKKKRKNERKKKKREITTKVATCNYSIRDKPTERACL